MSNLSLVKILMFSILFRLSVSTPTEYLNVNHFRLCITFSLSISTHLNLNIWVFSATCSFLAASFYYVPHSNLLQLSLAVTIGYLDTIILQCCTLKPYFSLQADVAASLNTGAVVGIVFPGTAVAFFIAGVLAGVLLYHCISKYRSRSSKSSTKQQQPVSSINPLQQTGPEYEEVIELSESMAYKPVKTDIEMRTNEAYQPTKQ